MSIEGSRSRCGRCGDFATEGEPHSCPKGGDTDKFRNDPKAVARAGKPVDWERWGRDAVRDGK